MPSGSPQFSGPSLLVSEYGVDEIAAYQVDGNGDPVIASRRAFITGLDGAEGALLDPVTGDFLFSTFGGGSRVIVVRGFRAPPPQLPPPQAGKTVNALHGARKGPDQASAATTSSWSSARASRSRSGRGRHHEGPVTIAAAGDQTADFYDGIFRLTQTRGATPLTTLTLVEKLSCPRGGKASAAAKQEDAQAVGGRQRQLQDRGQAQRGDRRRHPWLVPGPLRRAR